MIRVIDNYSGLPNGYLLHNFHTDLKYYNGNKVTGKGFQWITYSVLLHLIHINVDYLTMPLFSQRRSKLLI